MPIKPPSINYLQSQRDLEVAIARLTDDECKEVLKLTTYAAQVAKIRELTKKGKQCTSTPPQQSF